MTVKQILRKGKQKLKKENIPQYSLDAEVILSWAAGVGREYLFTHPQEALDQKVRDVFFRYIDKRIQGTPLAYIIGYKQFYGLDFFVDESVLIPRPETEIMVEKAEEYVNAKRIKTAGSALLDIGTGSGCLVITLARRLKNRIDKYFAFDVSQPALRVAYKNAKYHGVEQCIKFVHGSLLDPVFDNIKEYQLYNNFIITANLPYLTPEQYQNSLSIQKEPWPALVGGESGLDHYKSLLHQIKLLKLRTNSLISVLAEIDPDQKNVFCKLVEQEFNNYDLEFNKDRSDNWRLAVLRV